MIPYLETRTESILRTGETAVRILTLALTIPLISSGTASAADLSIRSDFGRSEIPANEALITQTGDFNLANYDQRVDANGSAHYVEINQNGTHNDAYVVQTGSANQARINQTGSFNAAGATQSGSANSIDLAQTGNYNIFIATQNGSNNHIAANQNGASSGPQGK